MSNRQSLIALPIVVALASLAVFALRDGFAWLMCLARLSLYFGGTWRPRGPPPCSSVVPSTPGRYAGRGGLPSPFAGRSTLPPSLAL